jgi:chemotaxis-related protein WspB
MLMLLFQIDDNRYAIEASRVIEVIPMVKLKKLYHVPQAIAGVFNYQGEIIPVLDLCHLIKGVESRPALSTRIILINHHFVDNSTSLLGLMAEKITETIEYQAEQWLNSGIKIADAPYLEKMLIDANDIVQRIQVNQLLSQQEQENLFLLLKESNIE